MDKITNYLNIATVRNINDPFSPYKCANFDPTLAMDDMCVVATGDHYVLASVDLIEDRPEDAPEFRWEVVDKVDTAEHKARVENRRLAASLKAKMQARAKQLQDIVLYQTLAKEDPEMADLLEKFKNIN